MNGAASPACTSSGIRWSEEKRHWISFIGSHLWRIRWISDLRGLWTYLT